MQMLFCKYTFECIGNSIVFYLKNNRYLTEIKKEKFSNFFLIIVNENLLYLKILSPFQPSLQKIIPYPGKSSCLFLKQTSQGAYLSDQRLALGNQRFSVWVQLLVMCRGELSVVITWLMFKCLWSGWKW